LKYPSTGEVEVLSIGAGSESRLPLGSLPRGEETMTQLRTKP